MINYTDDSEFKVRKARTEDDYFNEDDDTDYRVGSKPKPKVADDEPLPYLPAPGSPGPPDVKKAKEDETDSDSEEDPLDAFMANLEKDAKKQGVKAVATREEWAPQRLERVQRLHEVGRAKGHEAIGEILRRQAPPECCCAGERCTSSARSPTSAWHPSGPGPSGGPRPTWMPERRL